VAGLFRNISLRKKHFFFQFRIKILLHTGIFRIQRPVHKTGHGLLGTVGVEDFQAVALRYELVADIFQCNRRLFGQKGDRLLVTVNTVAYKI
jgi:hypothetical protein